MIALGSDKYFERLLPSVPSGLRVG